LCLFVNDQALKSNSMRTSAKVRFFSGGHITVYSTIQRIARGLLVILLVLAMCANARAGERQAEGALVQDRVVAGGPSDFLEARHIILKGRNEEIGQALAKLARDRHGVKPLLSSDAFRTRVQRRYVEEHYPILLERMKGVAACYGKSLVDDTLNFSLLMYTQIRPGCSVVYYPPGVTAQGTGIVSRYYDFTTGTMRGARPAPGELPSTARPYVIEMHPDKGYASVALCAYDLLSGVLDGINSEGLTVALLADDELHQKFPMQPTEGIAVGLGVLQMQRFLLDTCATVEEAKEALLLTKQYYEMLSVHYLIADRHGKAFVWEHSHAHNREYIIENDGHPLITTNFSLHRYLNQKLPPTAAEVKQVCGRYCALAERIAEQHEKVTVERIKETHRVVEAIQPGTPQALRPPNRTLWHALYFPKERKVQVSFYLRDEADSAKAGKPRIVRTDYVEFELSTARAARK
jgi:predicted choloylglycine hydrolase